MSTPTPASFAAFVKEYETQLTFAEVPRRLWPILHEKLANNGTFDAGSAIELLYTPTNGYLLAATKIIEPESDVFLVDHAVTFAGLDELGKQLAENAGLEQRLGAITNVLGPDGSLREVRRVPKTPAATTVPATTSRTPVQSSSSLPSSSSASSVPSGRSDSRKPSPPEREQPDDSAIGAGARNAVRTVDDVLERALRPPLSRLETITEVDLSGADLDDASLSSLQLPLLFPSARHVYLRHNRIAQQSTVSALHAEWSRTLEKLYVGGNPVAASKTGRNALLSPSPTGGGSVIDMGDDPEDSSGGAKRAPAAAQSVPATASPPRDANERDMTRREQVMSAATRFALSFYIARPDRPAEDHLTVYYIMDEVGSRVLHASDNKPNFALARFFHRGVSYSIMWPVRRIARGELISRDFAAGYTDAAERQRVIDACGVSGAERNNCCGIGRA